MTIDEFEYACFISYRSGNKLNDTFVKQLKDAIQIELGKDDSPHRKSKVYLDKDEIDHTPLSPQLAKAICKSYCMVLIYNDGYFFAGNSGKRYCAFEYTVMKMLEEERKLDLIIFVPIAIEERNYIPGCLASKTKYSILDKEGSEVASSFLRWNLSKGKIKSSREYNPIVEKICSDIKAIYDAIYQKLKNSSGTLCQDCNSMQVPSEENILKYAPPIPIQLFVGKTNETKLPHKKTGALTSPMI